MTTAAEIRAFLVDELGCAADPAELAGDLDLVETGVLDSLGIMELVEYLEATFDIVIDVDDVSAARFETIDSIVSLVDAKHAA